MLGALKNLRIGGNKNARAERKAPQQRNTFESLQDEADGYKTPVLRSLEPFEDLRKDPRSGVNLMVQGVDQSAGGNWEQAPMKKRARHSILPGPAAQPQLVALSHLNDNHWRDRAPETLRARELRIHQASQIRAATNIGPGGKSRMSWVPGPKTMNGDLESDHKPGTIVFRYDTRELGENTRVDKKYIFEDAQGKSWMRKGRYWIIVKRTATEIQEVAIYTNHDTGLKNHNDRQKRSYDSVRPLHLSSRNFVNQSPDNPVLEIDWMTPGREMKGSCARSTMVANFTEIRKRKIDQQNVKMIGALSEASTKVLVDQTFGPR